MTYKSEERKEALPWTMCLTVPARVVEVRGDILVITSRGWTRQVHRGELRVDVGDFVLAQGAWAVAQVEPTEAAEMLRAWDEVEVTGDA